MPRLPMLLFLFVSQATCAQVTWNSLEPGLAISEIPSPAKSEFGTNVITILKIDPAKFEFVMVNATAEDSVLRTAAGWCKKMNLISAVNAGMFNLTDRLTNTGFMKNFDHINNPALTANYKLVLAFNPKIGTLPPMQIIDFECDDWGKLKTLYNTYSQGLRVINCQRQVAWGKSAKKWSMVLWGIDNNGHALWLFTRSPLAVDVFARILLNLNIDVQRVMYLEGGPEASLLLNHPGKKLLLMGSYETGFNENDGNDIFWKVPNMIGIRRREGVNIR